MVRLLALHQTAALPDSLPVWFLGVQVTSAWIADPTDTNTISGTSMAAPYVLLSLSLSPLTSVCLPVVSLVSSSSILVTTARSVVRILSIVESRLAYSTHSTARTLSSRLRAAAISDVIGAPSGTTSKRAVDF